MLYDGYPQWKDAKQSPPEPHLFRCELRRAGIQPGSRVFEAGFGRGHFLAWARAAGYEASGCEIIPEYVSSARAAGLEVYEGQATQVLANRKGAFDLVVFFDVLEHVDVEALTSLMSATAQALRRGGMLLARFPNGGSPFGRLSQYGDLTHQTCLNSGSVGQLGHAAGLKLVGVFNSARDYRVRSPRGLLKFPVFAARDLIEIVVGYVYFGRRVPLDPNLTVLLKKE